MSSMVILRQRYMHPKPSLGMRCSIFSLPFVKPCGHRLDKIGALLFQAFLKARHPSLAGHEDLTRYATPGQAQGVSGTRTGVDRRSP